MQEEKRNDPELEPKEVSPLQAKSLSQRVDHELPVRGGAGRADRSALAHAGDRPTAQGHQTREAVTFTYGFSKLRDPSPVAPEGRLPSPTAFGRYGRSRSPSPSPIGSPTHSPRSPSVVAMGPPSTLRLKRRRTLARACVCVCPAGGPVDALIARESAHASAARAQSRRTAPSPPASARSATF